VIEGLPLTVNELNAPFHEGAATGRLMMPFCRSSQRAFWPPSPLSPYDSRGEITWRETSPLGMLVSRVIYRRCFQNAFEPLMPYAVGLVQLDAGPRLIAHLPNPDDASSAYVGDRVRIHFGPLIENGPWVALVKKS
jgi:uncharacterized protein